MNVLQINYHHDRDLRAPEAVFERYDTMTGWSDALTAAGATVRVVVRFPWRATLMRGGVTYEFVPSPNLYLARAGHRIDLAHVHGLVFSARVWWLRRLLAARTPIVMQNHGSLPPATDNRRAGPKHALRRVAFGAADALLFAASEQADAWRDAGVIDAQTTHEVLPASSTFTPIARQEARARSGMAGSPDLLWIGRLNANKDPLAVIEALDRCREQLPGARLTMIYTDQTLLGAVRQRIDGSPFLRDRVRLVGAVPHAQLPVFYSAADLFVVGSHYEGSGFSLIEACACGLTPVVTDIPSFRTITGRGAIGALWRPGDVDACSAALIRIGREQSDEQRLAIRAHFERTLSWSVLGRRALEIYRQVVARRLATLSS